MHRLSAYLLLVAVVFAVAVSGENTKATVAVVTTAYATFSSHLKMMCLVRGRFQSLR